MLVSSRSSRNKTVFLYVLSIVVCVVLGSTIFVERGSSHTFDCDVNITGNNSVKFTHNGMEIIASERIKLLRTSLIISNVILLDNGEYKCFFLSKMVQTWVLLSTERAKLRMNPATKSNTVTEGSDFVFSCEYTKNSNIKWQRFHEINGTEIMYTILDNLITDKSTDEKRIEEYRIENVSIADSGRYQCE
ncbi:uncharacterized protein LOC124447211 [Xenia sp. Carnegie-2017]|uniref:uncharacterized protein LOC124447211 n=1 Tax=Xenia sp. Carnegie-2017 TaxID=2897299 RepID=UPI001F03F01D|nr:uncharacterized protein LOC124447211 [Xenia sp. Carnegie-2017]